MDQHCIQEHWRSRNRWMKSATYVELSAVGPVLPLNGPVVQVLRAEGVFW